VDQGGSLERSRIRILVVDDYEHYRHFIASALSNQPKLQIVAEAFDGLVAVQKAEELQPDLILIDIGLPKLNGIEAARRIRKVSPNSKILFISQESSPDLVQAALGTGANGYLVKVDAGNQLLAALDAVLEGKVFVSASIANRGGLNFRDAQLAHGITPPSLQQVRNADLTNDQDFRTLMEDVLDKAIGVTHADFGTFQLLDPATGELRICVQRGFSSEFLKFFDRVHDPQCACGSALKARSRVVVDDVAESPIFSHGETLQMILEEQVRSVQSTPLVGASDDILGMLSTHYRKPQIFSQHSFEQLNVVASHAVQLIERWRRLQASAG